MLLGFLNLEIIFFFDGAIAKNCKVFCTLQKICLLQINQAGCTFLRKKKEVKRNSHEQSSVFGFDEKCDNIKIIKTENYLQILR